MTPTDYVGKLAFVGPKALVWSTTELLRIAPASLSVADLRRVVAVEPDRMIVGRPPTGLHLLQKLGRE